MSMSPHNICIWTKGLASHSIGPSY